SLKAIGIRFDNVPNVTNTQHIEATEVESQTHHTSTPPSNQGTQSNQSTSSSQSNNSTDDSSWMYDYGMTDEMWKEISDSVVGSNYGNLH
ncbi:MAG: hypothetical protein Q4F21_12065, partial [Lachnospiraceae bacterium]|nr:hypothetical protein [Lachnospiraceae bacterium]